MAELTLAIVGMARRIFERDNEFVATEGMNLLPFDSIQEVSSRIGEVDGIIYHRPDLKPERAALQDGEVAEALARLPAKQLFVFIPPSSAPHLPLVIGDRRGVVVFLPETGDPSLNTALVERYSVDNIAGAPS